MTEETKPTLNIDGTEHIIDDLDDTQKRTLNHIADLNNKISTASFQLEQLKIALSAMKNILKASFNKEDTKEEEK
tara:strand:- start:289 stop:513 length:225 start_codon:yes stop_codon:yes gene_type:complete